MSTSAEPFVIVARRYTDPAVGRLVDQVQAEYVIRYGGPDETPVDPNQFAPPAGVFLLGSTGTDPVACGGWRSYGHDAAEIKRMFVVASARRRGYAAAILAELEASARAAAKTRLVLETGTAQPEAIAMYSRSGFRPAEAFGHYRNEPSAVHLAKDL